MSRTHETDTFTLLLQPALASLRGYAVSWLRDPSDVDDAMQETAIKLLISADRFDPAIGSPEAWALTILRHECARLAKRRGRYASRMKLLERDEIERMCAVEWEPEEEIHMLIQAKRLAAAVRELPDPFRVAIEADVADDRPQREKAADLGIRHGTMLSRLHRGKARLREALAA